MITAVSIGIITEKNGMLKKANQSINTHKVAELKEKLEMIEGDFLIESFFPDSEIGLNDYINKIKEIGLANEQNISYDEDEEQYLVTIEDHVFTIKNGARNFMIQYECEKEQLKPIIKIISTEVTENKIKIGIKVNRNDEGILEFYIKKENEEYQLKETIESNNNIEYTYINLDSNEIYTAKIIAKAKNGQTAETEIELKTDLLETIPEVGKFMLYSYGDLCTNNSGGWTADKQANGGGVVFRNDSVLMKQCVQRYYYGTMLYNNTEIDISKFSKLYVRFDGNLYGIGIGKRISCAVGAAHAIDWCPEGDFRWLSGTKNGDLWSCDVSEFNDLYLMEICSVNESVIKQVWFE